MRWPAAFDRLAPDVVATIRRFPLASLLCLIETVLVVALINAQVEGSETWARLVAGIATAAIFATAGTLLRESGAGRVQAAVAEWALPALVFAAWQLDAPAWYIPYGLPLAGALYLSVAPTWPRRDEADAELRFWWITHQAVTTAVVAGAAFAIISLGLFAIERSLAILFSLQVGDIFYRWLLPVAGLLLLPLYWLSTLPTMASFSPGDLERPDFLARAAAFLGQFVLAPLLGAYALILLAYTVQIVLLQQLPVGVLGWMVTAFVIGGAATYLLIWPPFMRNRPIARLFRQWWFVATVIPLALFAVAVGVRIGAYGLTPERVGLIAAGLWAGILAIAFIARRGDIRMIPGVAAGLIVLFSIGPWNAQNAPILSQTARLESALARVGAVEGRPAPWPEDAAADARGALIYLLDNGGREALRGVLAGRGYAMAPGAPFGAGDVFVALGLEQAAAEIRTAYDTLRRDPAIPVRLEAPSLLIGQVTLNETGSGLHAGIALLPLAGGAFTASLPGGGETGVALAPWLAGQSSDRVIDAPLIGFALGERQFLLVVEAAGIEYRTDEGIRSGTITSLQGTLFETLR